MFGDIPLSTDPQKQQDSWSYLLTPLYPVLCMLNCSWCIVYNGAALLALEKSVVSLVYLVAQSFLTRGQRAGPGTFGREVT